MPFCTLGNSYSQQTGKRCYGKPFEQLELAMVQAVIPFVRIPECLLELSGIGGELETG